MGVRCSIEHELPFDMSTATEVHLRTTASRFPRVARGALLSKEGPHTHALFLCFVLFCFSLAFTLRAHRVRETGAAVPQWRWKRTRRAQDRSTHIETHSSHLVRGVTGGSGWEVGEEEENPGNGMVSRTSRSHRRLSHRFSSSLCCLVFFFSLLPPPLRLPSLTRVAPLSGTRTRVASPVNAARK